MLLIIIYDGFVHFTCQVFSVYKLVKNSVLSVFRLISYYVISRIEEKHRLILF